MKYSVEFIKRTAVALEVFGVAASIKVTITVDAPEMMAAVDKATEVLKHELGSQADKNYELIDIKRIA